MRILAVGDVEEPLLHEHYRPERWEGVNRVDLLLSCGDLPAEYLDFRPAAPDLCHHGFLTFRGLIERYQPRYWLHGHNHLSYARTQRVHEVGQTQVVNVYGHTIIEIDPPA